MRIRLGLQAFVLGTVILGGSLSAQPSAPGPGAPPGSPASALAECDRLRAENLKLRAQVLDLQRALAQLQLETEAARLQADRQQLEATFRALLKPAATDVFDWSSLTFGPPKPIPAPATQP
jgi:outer membrane murein-binding lipoprotein Lpp